MDEDKYTKEILKLHELVMAAKQSYNDTVEEIVVELLAENRRLKKQNLDLTGDKITLRGYIDHTRYVLINTQKLVSAAAMGGFGPGDWTDELYANQAKIHEALTITKPG